MEILSNNDITVNFTSTPHLGILSITYEYNTTTLSDLTDAIIDGYLKKHKHNISKVAKLLGITRQTIYNWEKRRQKRGE